MMLNKSIISCSFVHVTISDHTFFLFVYCKNVKSPFIPIIALNSRWPSRLLKVCTFKITNSNKSHWKLK